MAAHFQIVVTSGFSRSLKRITSKHSEVVDLYETALEALEVDPSNVTRTRDIKKLSGVPAGDGQWRMTPLRH
jgi:hypothetical protein